MTLESLDVVCFVGTRAQASDAHAILFESERRAEIVTLHRSASAYVEANVQPAQNIGWIDVSTSLPTGIHKMSLILRGKALVRRFVAQKGPCLFVFGNDTNPVEGALIRSCDSQGCRSLLVQDGFLDKYNRERYRERLSGRNRRDRMIASRRPVGRLAWRGLEEAGIVPPFRVYGTGECDCLAVHGRYTCDLLVEWGVAPDKIYLTGAPRFDPLFNMHPGDSRSKRRVLCLGLILSDKGWGSLDDDLAWFSAIVNLASVLRGYEVVLRPHPEDKEESYNRLLSTFDEPEIVIDRDRELYDVMTESDLIVTHYTSTVLLEAAILRKPMVFVDLGLRFQRNDFIDRCPIARTCAPSQLAGIAASLLKRDSGAEPNGVREFLVHHLGFLDGESGLRVAALIDSLCEPHNG